MKGYSILYLMIVFGIVASCEEIIEVPDISDKTVQVLAPQSGTQIDTTLINFNWVALEDADEYRLQIADPNFVETQQIVADTVVSQTQFQFQLEAGNYEWRINASNSAYETAYITLGFEVLP